MNLPSCLSGILRCPEGEKEEDWALDLASKSFATGETFYVERLTEDTKNSLKDCGFTISHGVSMLGLKFVPNPGSTGYFDKYMTEGTPNYISYDIIEYQEPR